MEENRRERGEGGKYRVEAAERARNGEGGSAELRIVKASADCVQ